MNDYRSGEQEGGERMFWLILKEQKEITYLHIVKLRTMNKILLTNEKYTLPKPTQTTIPTP
jgi:hypothetical protein